MLIRKKYKTCSILINSIYSVHLPRVKWMDYWKSLLDDSIYIQANINEQYIPGK